VQVEQEAPCEDTLHCSVTLTQVAQPWQTDRTMLAEMRQVGDFKGQIIFRLNFRLKGYFSRQYLWTVR